MTKLVDILERQGSMRAKMKFHQVDEVPIDVNRELEKKRLMNKYQLLFKDELEKSDRLKINPIKLELIQEYEEIKLHDSLQDSRLKRYFLNSAAKEKMEAALKVCVQGHQD